MIELPSLGPAVEATALVGLVLVEAVALYVAYGTVERVLAPQVIDALSAD